MRKKVYVYSNGCSSNLLDGQRIVDYFMKNNYDITNDPKKADLCVVNTCSFERISKKDSLRKIKELNKTGKKVIVGGCLPAMHKKELDAIPGIGYFIPKNEETWRKLDDMVNAKVPICRIRDPNIIHYHGDWKLIGKYKAFGDSDAGDNITGYDESAYNIRVASGCLRQCTYCAIRYARGPLKSKNIGTIIKEFRKGLEKGYTSFKIWADDIGDYGKDIGTDLAELLESILEIDGNYELEVLTTNPNSFADMYDRLLSIFKDERIRYFNISVQSGSEHILRRMKREINIGLLKEKIIELKKRSPHLILRYHLMVGFPGETWSDFLDTVKFSYNTRIFKYLIFSFDPKPNTLAASMDNQVPKHVKRIRHLILGYWGKIMSGFCDDGDTY